MKNQSPALEWHILDELDDCVDEHPLATFFEPETPPSAPPHKGWAIAAAATLMILLAAAYLGQRGQAGLDRLATELQAITEAEVWAAAHGDAGLAADLAADPSAGGWRQQVEREAGALGALQAAAGDPASGMEIEIIDLDADRAVAQVTIRAGSHGDRYRQVRFYQSTAAGWRHTAPAVEWWGAPQRLESSFFVFEFRKKDTAVVAEIAPQADAIYTKMRRDFGLALTPAREKPIVEISPTEVPGAALLRSNRADRFVVPSPALYLAPATMSDADLVLQSLALQLSAAVVDEVVTHYQIFWVHDENILSALRLWALWDLDLPLAEWHKEVVAWRLGAMQGGAPAGRPVLPSHYEALCANHYVWLSSPSLISIPLTCTELDRAPLLASAPVSLSATRLEQLTTRIFWEDSTLPGGILWPSPSWTTVLLSTLFEYTVSRYGREQLPVFLAGLGRYRDWPAFSMAVFDTPSSQLAAEWYAYLVALYGTENGQGEAR